MQSAAAPHAKRNFEGRSCPLECQADASSGYASHGIEIVTAIWRGADFVCNKPLGASFSQSGELMLNSR